MSTTEPDPRPDEPGPPTGSGQPPADPPPAEPPAVEPPRAEPPPAFPPSLPPSAPGLPPPPPLSPTERSSGPAGSTRTRLAVIGGIVGVALYGLLVAASFATGGSQEGYWVLALFFGMIVLTIGLLIVGGVLVAFQQTRSFAIGLLIAIAIGVFVSGGVCVAAMSTTG